MFSPEHDLSDTAGEESSTTTTTTGTKEIGETTQNFTHFVSELFAILFVLIRVC